jgi:hypothetical protein
VRVAAEPLAELVTAMVVAESPVLELAMSRGWVRSAGCCTCDDVLRGRACRPECCSGFVDTRVCH